MAKQVVIGWREWIALPALGIAHIKAKIDTGARTSALHAFDVEPFQRDGIEWIRFRVHPWQKNNVFAVSCEHPVKDSRLVSDSGGHRERRYVIETFFDLGPVRKTIEITLTNRDTMLFRFLLGRTALRGDFHINPDVSFLFGRPKEKPSV